MAVIAKRIALSFGLYHRAQHPHRQHQQSPQAKLDLRRKNRPVGEDATKLIGGGKPLPPPLNINKVSGDKNMSAERMMVNAMQEQPILLLPLFAILYFVMHLLKRMAASINNSLTVRLLR